MSVGQAVEVNFDGLVGPTHNYAGLSFGNLASARNRDAVARPREAALQGLAKMRTMLALGLPQAVFAPQWRPNIPWLRTLGFSGSDRDVWAAAWASDRSIARAAVATSSMWAANAATVSPSADCADGRLHFTAANLITMLHRSQEAVDTQRQLARVFADPRHFVVHEALPAQATFSDEGAANHMRLCAEQGAPGVEVFIYGRAAGDAAEPGFPARQTLEACEAIARRHGLDPARTIHAPQSRRAIAAGAFHNDVVAVAHETTLFAHEDAFEDAAALQESVLRASDGRLQPAFVVVPRAAVPIEDAVTSYLFNSQLVRTPGDNRLTLIAPTEAQENAATARYLEDLVASDSPIGAVRFVDVRQSMRNGGGPACLRLRVTLTPEERAAATDGFFLDEARIAALEAWVQAHYREELAPADVGDPALVDETAAALDALTQILPLGGDFYPFQRGA